MKSGVALAAALFAVFSLALTVQAAPPEGKGPGNKASSPGSAGNGAKGNPHASGNSGKGNPGKDHSSAGHAKRTNDSGRRYDDRGRDYGYFDDNRDRHGHLRGGDVSVNLVYAGITAALAHEYAVDFGLVGYSVLPPGIRMNLQRGKPLPPGIAKKMVPSSLLGRLPRHPGYEWRVAGADLILVSIATAVVADILYDVFD